MHLEDAACSGNQCEFREFLLEGCEQLLRHPRRSKQPAALCAVGDGYAVSHGQGLYRLTLLIGKDYMRQKEPSLFFWRLICFIGLEFSFNDGLSGAQV